MAPVRLAVIGAGRGAFAGSVASRFPEDLVVTAVCDRRFDRAVVLADRLQAPFRCERLEEALERADIDAVLLATPDSMHASQAARSLRAGKHVLSEIPMAYTIEEIDEIVSLSESTGMKYALGNEVRWFPALQELHRMAEEGWWGTPFYGEAEYLHNLRAEGWRSREPDGSIHWRFDPAGPQTTFLGGGPHAFDTLRWLAGESNFTEVFAYGVGRYHPDHPEPGTAVALLRGTSGAAYKVTVSYEMVRPYALYFSLYGPEGSFEGGRVDQSQVFFRSKRYSGIDGRDEMTLLDCPYWVHPGVDPVEGHGTSELFMMKDFIEAIRDDHPPAIDAREAARSTAPAIRAFESIRTGRPAAIPAY